MIKYKISKIKKQYHVIEKATDIVIRKYKYKKDAVRFGNFLNGGGGFNGFTPNFFMITEK
jgi:hypothetical protein